MEEAVELLRTFLVHLTFQSVLIYFVIGLIVWYIVYGFEMYLNGGSHGRGRWWVFKCFWEEMLWFLPGGLAKRADYIRKMVGSRNGYLGKYSYEEIRKQNLYADAAKSSLGNGFYFWGVNVILAFFLWPFLLVAIVALVALNGVMGIVAIFIPALRS